MCGNIHFGRLVACFGLFFALVFSSASMLTAAGQLREVVLKDGSVIRAEILSFKDGVYRLHSATMGDFQLDDEAIKVIRDTAAAGNNAEGSPDDSSAAKTAQKQEIKGYQQSLLTSPSLIGMVLALQNDPEVQKVLQDDEVMALILSGNTQELESNPKFVKLMENPKIRAILDEMGN